MSKKTITVLHLYPREMNIYGDRGNVLTIARRLEWHGITPHIITHSPGDAFPGEVDMVLGGGGQDSGQAKVQDDLLRIGSRLHALTNDYIPMLMVCGLYQLFGRFFKTAEGEVISGIGIFDAETVAGPKRLIGNVVLRTPFGEVVGYENHSGLTTLDAGQEAFGRVKKGAGNNGRDKTEGAVNKNVFGTYLHGPILPKNPTLADAFINVAVTRKYGEFEPHIIPGELAEQAHRIAAKRPR